MSDLVSRWAGLALCGIGLIATLALAATGNLTLYIHPRYVVFTVLLSVVGAVLFAAAVWFTATARGETHDEGHTHDAGHTHDDGHAQANPLSSSRRAHRVVSAALVSALVVVAAAALLAVPPTALSAERALSSASAPGGGDAPRPSLIGSDPTLFSVRDWASILGSGATAGDLVGQQADVTGFLLVDADGIRVGRYAVTCCTVDAQLFAVPLAVADLPTDLQSGDWVHLTGTFTDENGVTHLSPDTIDAVEEPDAPYLS